MRINNQMTSIMKHLYKVELEKKYKSKKLELESIGRWLLLNIKHPEWHKKVNKRNQLSVEIEVIRQQLTGRWKKTTVQDTFNLNSVKPK